MLGMRFTFHNEHNRPSLTDGSADWLWPAAERAGIPLKWVMGRGVCEWLGWPLPKERPQ
jgi:hypothetical protein